MDRALVSGTRCRGFDSRRVYHIRIMDNEITIELKDGKLSPEELEELCTLGYNLENGILYKQDKTKALALYKRAYEEGSSRGANNFGYLLSLLGTSRSTTMMALSVLEEAAKAGNTVAMVNIGNIYEYGQRTGKPEYKEAAKWYQRAALLGDKRGSFNYANLLHYGRGVRRDRETAFCIFEKLAKCGVREAPFYMGLYYENGFVVEKNYSEALRYYQAGASMNDPYCYNQLGRMYCLGLGIPRKEPKMGFYYYEQAAKLGDVTGLSNMAYAYETGQGVEADLVKAVEYYSRAAEAGEVNAIEALERLRNELMPAPTKRGKVKTTAKSTKKTDEKDSSKDSEDEKLEK